MFDLIKIPILNRGAENTYGLRKRQTIPRTPPPVYLITLLALISSTRAVTPLLAATSSMINFNQGRDFIDE